jgi:hypothetical protein
MIIDKEMIQHLSEVNNCTLEEAETLYAPDFVKILEARNEEYLANRYKEDRKEEYPSIEEVTVALAEKAEGDSTMWDEVSAKRLDIKSKYPKTI